MKKRAERIYTFYNSRMHLCVKATCFVEALEWLNDYFGRDWVKSHLDDLTVNWYHSNK